VTRAGSRPRRRPGNPGCRVGAIASRDSSSASASFVRGANSQAVAVRIAELDLARPRLLFGRRVEFASERVDVVDEEINQRVRTRVAFVLGQKKSNRPTIDRDECGQPRLEAVLPGLAESESLVPLDGTAGVLDVEDRDRALVHDCTATNQRPVNSVRPPPSSSKSRSDSKKRL